LVFSTGSVCALRLALGRPQHPDQHRPKRLVDGTATGNGLDLLSAVEGVFGSSFDDTLIGDDTGNVLDDSSGNDTIRGGEGADDLVGNHGDDEVYGEGGDDLLGRLNEFGDDTIHGGPGDDVITSDVTAFPRFAGSDLCLR
jgi:Ca2+-binding RTX toxin-like protein